MNYTHLSQSERYQISALLKAGHGLSEIANILGRHRSTIYREVSRNSGLRGYRPKQAELLASQRSERPANVEKRSQIGHWEGDTLIGKGHKQAIVSLVERKSGYAVLKKVTKKTSELVSSAIIKGLKPISGKVKTITFDNGREFSDHAKIDKALESVSYFADPFSSWQRGSNENLNGLVRQYIPKNRPLSTVTHDELAMIQDRLNNRPRKRLGFKTPNEVFQASFKSVALRG